MSKFEQAGDDRRTGRAAAGVTEPTIACPSCATEIRLTESLAAPLIQATRQEYEAKIAQKEKDVAAREGAIRDEKKAIDEARNSINEQVAERLKTERAAIAAEEAKKAKRAAASDLEAKDKEVAELQDLLTQRNAKLDEAQKAHADVLRKQRELDDAKRELDLTVEKRVQASLVDERQKAKNEADDELRLKVAEREQQIASMQRQIDDLKRKAEQGSQQLQGEVLELEIEAMLQANFPMDSIEPVGKGESGADVLQRVFSPTGQTCGAILWESKRTKNWSDSWLPKLRADQRAANAEVAVLASRVLPKGIDSFAQVDGIWITDPRFALPLVIALRQTLMEVANTRQAQVGQATKMELVYDYLTGPKFRRRVEAIAEHLTEMQADLNREKKAMTRLWAKREAQIHGLFSSTLGMYGDLQGIAGRALQEIEGLDLPLLEGEVEEPAEMEA